MSSAKPKHKYGLYRFYAPIYDRIVAPSFSEGHAVMYDELSLKSGDKVLEVGVGTGISLKHYPANIIVDAIDASEPMLKEARENLEEGVNADVRLHCMDAHHLEFDDDSFDCAIIAHAIAVVAEPDVVLKEMIRVTKTKGRIVIVNYYKESVGILERMWTPIRRRLGLGRQIDLLQLIKDNGLELLKSKDVNKIASKLLVCKIP